MEYAKDEVFHIHYHEGKNKVKGNKEKSKLLRFWQHNTTIKVITSLTVVLSIANFILIYHFFSILSKL